MHAKLRLSFVALMLALSPLLQAEMAHIPADRDATLIEDAHGALANGSGPALFAGRTGQAAFGLRRGLIRFDVAGALPERAIIDRVFLSLYQTSNNNPDPRTVSLHRVLQDWGEGSSFSSGGGGATAGSGDATWLHTDYDAAYWTMAGGHFVTRPSADALIDGAGFYTWQGSSLVTNVLLWLHSPQRNFGWLLMGDEGTAQSSKRFASREAADPAQHPVLTIEYHLPGE